jgi:outer membrane protein insertion porin family
VLQSARIDVARHTAAVTFDIFEGPQSRVVELKYKGLPIGFNPSSAAQVRIGKPFRTNAVEDTRRALERALGREGYLFARVDGESSLSVDGRDARVFFRVEPGPRVRVGQVIVRGTKRTDEGVIRANLVVREGSVLDPEALFESQRNLVLLGLFRNVAVKLISPEVVEATKDVVVEVRERPRMAGEIGGGYSLVDGPRLMGDLVYPNIFGSGMSLSGRMKVNYMGASAQVLSDERFDPAEVSGFDGVDFRGNIAVSQPRIYGLLPAKVGARLDLIGERAHHPSSSYTFQRLAAVAGLDWSALQWLNMTLQYEIERDNVQLSRRVEELLPTLGRTDLERLRFPSGDFPLHSLRPTITLDFRDDFARPSKGLLISGSAELTNDFGAALTDADGELLGPLPIHTLKVSGNITGYVPLAPRTVLALSARGGKIFHLTEDSQTIAPKRFFLGGSTTMRGFSEESIIAEDRRADLREDVLACRTLAHTHGCTPDAKVLREGRQLPSEGGELYTLFKSELRFPAYGAFDLGVFFEAGNLWLDADVAELLDLRYVAGAGLRYGTPIGPLALDVGFNLFPDRDLNEPTANLHFSIGLF